MGIMEYLESAKGLGVDGILKTNTHCSLFGICDECIGYLHNGGFSCFRT